MELGWILKLVLFGVAHWVLVGLVLPDLASRQRILGGKKWVWAVAIIFATCFGSIAYLLAHPQMLTQGYSTRGVYHEEKEDRYC